MGSGEFRSGLRFVLTGSFHSSSRGDCATQLAVVCRALAKETGAQILMIPQSFGPTAAHDDRPAAWRLARHIDQEIPVHLVDEPLSAPDLKALIGCCDLYLGVRYHSLVAVLSQAVPAMA